MARDPEFFHGKTILITGAASGIGRATALIFAREGARVVAADIDGAGAEETSAAVRAAGSEVVSVVTDVTDREAVDAMVAAGIDAYGAIDFLFNSAGAAGRRRRRVGRNAGAVPGDRCGALAPGLRAQRRWDVQCHPGRLAAYAGTWGGGDRQHGLDGA